MTPDVSILVVSKDDAADLPVSLGSALAQRGAACETLLVDNASTDGSREVAADSAGGAAPGASGERRLRGGDERRNRSVARAATCWRSIPTAGSSRTSPRSSRAGWMRRTRATSGRPRGGSSAPRARARGERPARLDRHLLHGFGPPLRPGRGGARGRRAISPKRRSSAPPAPPASTGERPSRPRGSRPGTSTPTSSSTARTRTWRGGFAPGWRCLYVPDGRGAPPPAQPPRAAAADDARSRTCHSVKNRFLLRINNQTPASSSCGPLCRRSPATWSCWAPA